jgi:hypothetical protein
MPQTLATPVLQVDANVIHQVDTNNPDNLHSMWTGKLKLPLLPSGSCSPFANSIFSLHQVRRRSCPGSSIGKLELAPVEQRNILLRERRACFRTQLNNHSSPGDSTLQAVIRRPSATFRKC